MTYMDERSVNILHEILKNPNVSTQALGKSFQLSKRQIDYSFTKINEWLNEKDLPMIYKKSNGHFELDTNLLVSNILNNDNYEQEGYIFTKDERKNLILLMIFTNLTELSVSHFTNILNVSTATVMRDIKNLQQELKKINLEISYTRKDGYQIKGDEWEIRRKIMELLLETYYMFQGEEYLQKYTMNSGKQIQATRQKLEHIEEQLDLKFTDEKIVILPYMINILLKRINKGHTINFNFQINYHELSDTREYHIIEFLLEDGENLSEAEKLFMTLQLLTSNISSQSTLNECSLPKLKCVLQELLILIEKRALVHFKDPFDLVNNLVTHMKPAYYRIKYQLTIDSDISNTLPSEFQTLHSLIKYCIHPLEKFIGANIPDSEIYYITLLIGGYLIRTGEPFHQFKPTAIILCTNGVTISKLLESILIPLFPEFHFYPTTSIREFEKSLPIVDVVFSVNPLIVDDSSLLYIIGLHMDQRELQQLRRRVLQEISSASDTLQKESDILLQHLIHPEKIRIVEEVESWQESLTIASAMLLKKGDIHPRYMEAMNALYPQITPSILLKGNVLIPHARPEDGVNRLGLSILIVKNGIVFEGKKIHVIVVVAPCDKSKHLQAMLQLLTVAADNKLINELKDKKNPTDVFLYLQETLGKIEP